MKLPPGYVPGLLTQHKATAKGGFGEKLLRQFGWTEGKGLGAKEDGMAEALKVKQKKDQTGVGAHGSEMWRDKWWEEAYAQSVATISGAAEGKLEESSSDSDSSDSEDSTAEVPAAGRRTHADGVTSSATAAEQKLAAELAKDPWGRFGGRQGKVARIRAQEEAALEAGLAAAGQSAALPAAGKAAAPTAAAEKKAKRRKRDAVADVQASEAEAAPPAKRKKGDKAAAKLAKAAVEAAAAASQPREPMVADRAEEAAQQALRAFVPTPKTGWWGARRFISAGAMGSAKPPPKLAEDPAHGFTEDTQEGLYMALHNAKTSGKTGLGKGKGSGIIGGAKWEGKKTVIEDDEPTEQGTQTACEGSPAVDEAPSSPAAAPAKSFKYAKIVRKLLRQAEGQQLTLKQLSKQVRQHWAAVPEFGAPPDATSLKAIIQVKLERIEGVSVKRKRVALA